jgi:hypothetical protein
VVQKKNGFHGGLGSGVSRSKVILVFFIFRLLWTSLWLL